MSNVFAEGKVAIEEQFIGREDLVNQVYGYLYNDSKNIAMVGLPRIGKTSIAFKVESLLEKQILQKQEKIILLLIDLANTETFEMAWFYIIQELYDKFLQLGLVDSEIEREAQYFLEKQPNNYSLVKIHAEKFLRKLKKLNVRVILIIDEFDRAVEIFEGKRYYYEFFREIASTPLYSVTLMLISRQLIKKIEANAYGNSTLFGVMKNIIVSEFDEKDFLLYKKKLSCNGYSFNNNESDELEGIAGHNPFLLCIIGNQLLEEEQHGKKITPSQVYHQNKTLIFNYFDALINQMDRDKNLSYVQQVIIGPRYNITKNDVDMLLEMGYLTKRNDSEFWMVISKEFSQYLRNKGQKKDIWHELSEAQLLLQRIVKLRLPVLLGYKVKNMSDTEFNNMLDKEHVLDDDTNKYFVRNNKEMFDVDSTYVDVTSIKKISNVLKQFWDNSENGFRYCFGNQSFEMWSECFDRMHESRIACAHIHPEYLTKEKIERTNMFCKRIKEVLERYVLCENR